MKDVNPHIYFMRCICHSAHLCARHAYEKLPRTAEEPLRDIYNYSSHSAKWQSEYAVVDQFIIVEPHKLLRPMQTVGLSFHSCVSRVLEQWGMHYVNILNQFLSEITYSQNILAKLQNPIWELYFYFLGFVLSKFSDLMLHSKVQALQYIVCIPEL